MKMPILPLFLISFVTNLSYSQIYKPDLQDIRQISISDRDFKFVEDKGKRGIKIESGDGSRLIIVNDVIFGEGEVEFDAKGKNEIGKSFLGLAFHIQNDSTYDAIYFRPFNFSNPDTIRRWRAIQYVSLPKYDWDKLREEFPGKYENKVSPVPDADDWFHSKIIVSDKIISVFVNNALIPSLVVEKLTTTSKGRIALWVENGSDGSFANLKIKAKN